MLKARDFDEKTGFKINNERAKAKSLEVLIAINNNDGFEMINATDFDVDKAQIFTIVALVVYAVAMAIIGCISYKGSKTLDGFLLGGRKVGGWVTAFAYGTTYFSAVGSTPRRVIAYNKTVKKFCQAYFIESLFILNIFTLSAFYTQPYHFSLFY